MRCGTRSLLLFLALVALAPTALAASRSGPGIRVPASRSASDPLAPPALGLTLTGSQAAATIRPGAAGVALFALSITNNNVLMSRTLLSLRLANTTSGAGSTSARDGELGNTRLYRDNGNRRYDAGVDVLTNVTTDLIEV